MKGRAVDLTKYATQYDNMARFKPSYLEVQQVVADSMERYLQNKTGILIEDAGAGTGELSRKLAERFPESKIHAVEMNSGFYEKLCEKVVRLDNVETVKGDIESKLFDNNHFEVITMIHVLNFTQHAKEALAIERAYEQLKPGGIFIIADIGRILDLKAHAKETLRAAYKAIGLFRTIRLYLSSLQVIKQNRIFVENQRKGIHPLHNLDQFLGLIQSKGFKVLEKRNDLYLGDDDFIVAQKPP
jgi:ubiquinone/menaquinone biosynthesis C-methylase UbiE